MNKNIAHIRTPAKIESNPHLLYAKWVESAKYDYFFAFCFESVKE